MGRRGTTRDATLENMTLEIGLFDRRGLYEVVFVKTGVLCSHIEDIIMMDVTSFTVRYCTTQESRSHYTGAGRE